MGKQSQNVPIEQALLIAERFDKDQVIILTRDREHCSDTVTTWGRSDHDKDLAAEAGNRLKLAIGWKPENCNAVSAKVNELYEVLEMAMYELVSADRLKSTAYREITNVLAHRQVDNKSNHGTEAT